MTGWVKAGLIIGLALMALVALNVSMWRRMKAVIAERRDWTEADFVASLEALGCRPIVADAVLGIVRPYYHAGVAPQIGDDLKRFVAVDEDEVEDWTAQAFTALGLPTPTSDAPEVIPSLATVGDWAIHVERRYAALKSSLA